MSRKPTKKHVPSKPAPTKPTATNKYVVEASSFPCLFRPGHRFAHLYCTELGFDAYGPAFDYDEWHITRAEDCPIAAHELPTLLHKIVDHALDGDWDLNDLEQTLPTKVLVRRGQPGTGITSLSLTVETS